MLHKRLFISLMMELKIEPNMLLFSVIFLSVNEMKRKLKDQCRAKCSGGLSWSHIVRRPTVFSLAVCLKTFYSFIFFPSLAQNIPRISNLFKCWTMPLLTKITQVFSFFFHLFSVNYKFLHYKITKPYCQFRQDIKTHNNNFEIRLIF